MKSIMVITTSFAPENAIGSVRMAKLVKYLVRLGHEVCVVSPALDSDTRRDPSLECAEFDKIQRHTVEQGRLFRALVGDRRKKLLNGNSAVDLVSLRRKGLAAYLRSTFFRYLRFAYTLFRNWDWERQVWKFYHSRLAGQSYDVILSSYPSLGAMWAASRLRRAGAAPYWVADFRDPINYEANADWVVFRLNSLIQDRILATADATIAISEGVANRIHKRGRPMPHVLFNGFDPEDGLSAGIVGQETEGKTRFRLSYAGSLYGGTRDISVVFRAIRDLVDSGVMPVAGIEFQYAGSDLAALLRQARETDLEGIVLDRGMISRRGALEMQRASDLVVVATWNTEADQGIMTGKLFECFMMRRPILGIVNGDKDDSEFKRVVSRVRAGCVYESAAADAQREYCLLRDFIGARYAEYRSSGSVAGEYSEEVLDFSYPRLAASLSAML